MTQDELERALRALGVKYAVLDTGDHQRTTMGASELAEAIMDEITRPRPEGEEE